MFRKKNNRSADKGQSEQVTEVMNGNLPNGGGLQEPPEDPSVSGKVSSSDDSAEKESVHPVDLESISGVVRVTAAEMGIGNAAGGKASAVVSGQDSSSGKNTESSVSSSEESAKEENSAGSSRKSSRSSGKSETPEAADAGNVKADNPVSEKKGGSGDSEVKTSESGNRGRKSSGKRISGEEVTAATGAGDSDKDKGDSAATAGKAAKKRRVTGKKPQPEDPVEKKFFRLSLVLIIIVVSWFFYKCIFPYIEDAWFTRFSEPALYQSNGHYTEFHLRLNVIPLLLKERGITLPYRISDDVILKDVTAGPGSTLNMHYELSPAFAEFQEPDEVYMYMCSSRFIREQILTKVDSYRLLYSVNGKDFAELEIEDDSCSGITYD